MISSGNATYNCLVQMAVTEIDCLLSDQDPALAYHLSVHAEQSLGTSVRPWLLSLFSNPEIPTTWRTWLWDMMATTTECRESNCTTGMASLRYVL